MQEIFDIWRARSSNKRWVWVWKKISWLARFLCGGASGFPAGLGCLAYLWNMYENRGTCCPRKKTMVEAEMEEDTEESSRTGETFRKAAPTLSCMSTPTLISFKSSLKVLRGSSHARLSPTTFSSGDNWSHSCGPLLLNIFTAICCLSSSSFVVS